MIRHQGLTVTPTLHITASGVIEKSIQTSGTHISRPYNLSMVIAHNITLDAETESSPET